MSSKRKTRSRQIDPASIRGTGLGLFLAASALLASVPTARAAMALPPFEAHYSVAGGGLLVGHATFTLQRINQSTWVYQSETHAAGLLALFRSDEVHESTHFSIDNGVLQPLKYQYRYSNGDDRRAQDITFDWTANTAEDIYGDQRKSLTLKPGTLDRLLAQLRLSLDLAGPGLADEYLVLDKGDLDIYHLKKVGTVKVRVPAGSYDTIKVERQSPNGKRTTTFWFAPALRYLPVRMEQREKDEPTLAISLTDLKWNDAAAPEN